MRVSRDVRRYYDNGVTPGTMRAAHLGVEIGQAAVSSAVPG
jgi:hypothetical protein